MPVASSITEMDLQASETLLEDFHQRSRRFRRRVRRRVRNLSNDNVVAPENNDAGHQDNNADDQAGDNVDQVNDNAVAGDPAGDDVDQGNDNDVAIEQAEPGVAHGVDGQNIDLNEAIPDAAAFEGAAGVDDDDEWSFSRIDEARRLDHLEQILLKENRDFHLHC